MKEDRDLLFLSHCNSGDLKRLVDLMTHDKDGKMRYAEQLTNTDAYIYCYPNRLQMMWRDIANELQRFGGNTLMNVCRGGGVRYREILNDVCRKMQVYYTGRESTAYLEEKLLQKMCVSAVNGMSEDELRVMAEDLEMPTKNPRRYAIVAAVQLAIRRGGALFTRIAVYITRMMARMLLGRGAAMVGSNVISRAVGIAGGPVGWAISAGWIIYDVTSPAYRVTVPCVMQVACMRMQQMYNV
ncbi:MAG: DUF3944 domain-containing protein [Bacteroidaceae bacterium]|nr:DUF3944 domain-containing protein [Bacteroidaceae bacterium]